MLICISLNAVLVVANEFGIAVQLVVIAVVGRAAMGFEMVVLRAPVSVDGGPAAWPWAPPTIIWRSTLADIALEKNTKTANKNVPLIPCG